ncbi:hypothetical protein TW95_gp1521 [Pandoravirus inopinatum]|uniref:Uncharacterized protein n=1 Tax=Pandoravirus inopinatum TaxID=1605721 RepID=A0A0B5J8K6_9VIRU|nr:hypothetical protein TW95_gp1521 [Pandoravirus inopinatum]AJF98255.1 hypothetical protein [Pandoravirus inopinatum]
MSFSLASWDSPLSLLSVRRARARLCAVCRFVQAHPRFVAFGVNSLEAHQKGIHTHKKGHSQKVPCLAGAQRRRTHFFFHVDGNGMADMGRPRAFPNQDFVQGKKNTRLASPRTPKSSTCTKPPFLISFFAIYVIFLK